MDLLAQTYEKVILAVLAVPTIKSWIIALLLLLVIVLFCLPIGLWCNFLENKKQKLSFMKFIGILASRLLFPCLAEELIFRVLLLPEKNTPTSIKTQILLGVVSLTTYVVSHPVNATLFYRRALGVFTHPFFLLSTTILGLACTITYVESGSIWTPVAVHWITIIGWLLTLGGYSKLRFVEE